MLPLVVLPRTVAAAGWLACWFEVVEDAKGSDAVPGLLAMAEVERRLVGRRPWPGPLVLSVEESCLSRRWLEASWWWSPLLAAAVGLGVCAEEKEGEGPGVRTDGDMEKVAEEGWLLAPAVEREAEMLTGPTPAAEDWDLWRMDSSEGLRRRSWLLEERWPGVWLRGICGARSRASSASAPVWYEEDGRGSVGEVTLAIFCERMTLFLSGEWGVLDLPLSAIVRWDHDGGSGGWCWTWTRDEGNE